MESPPLLSLRGIGGGSSKLSPFRPSIGASISIAGVFGGRGGSGDSFGVVTSAPSSNSEPSAGLAPREGVAGALDGDWGKSI